MKPEYIIAGNWKMNKTPSESMDFVKELNNRLTAHTLNEAIEVLVFPPFLSLPSLKGVFNLIKKGAQNFFYENSGAFTGEISPLMLKGLVTYLLIGHSERRLIFKETDTQINKKIKAALTHGFTPILCIGESLDERESNKTFIKLEEQLIHDLAGLNAEEIQKIMVAYEPIWAIGTGKNATPQQAQEAHAFIRLTLEKKFASREIAKSTRILYGGSVKPNNSHELLSQKDINGVLVGGASLKLEDFFAIIQSAYKLVN